MSIYTYACNGRVLKHLLNISFHLFINKGHINLNKLSSYSVLRKVLKSCELKKIIPPKLSSMLS